MGHSGDGCDLALTLCKYDLRKGDLFVLSWARVRRLMREVSLQRYLCVVEVCTVFCYCLLWLDAETVDVCIWGKFVLMSVVVTVWESVVMFVV